MSSLDRDENLGRLRGGGTWDVVVIGGGATGLGAAVDAAARGYRTALLEARDFAQGTSSRSTKLIHGGVRYLAQGDIPLVREALHERGVLFRNAPHLVHRRDFIVPAYRWRDLPFYGIGLKVYDLLAGRSNLGGSRWIGPAEVARRIPTIVGRGLRGGIVYTDGQFDDARLAIALARTFADLGGTALNHAPVVGFSHRDGRIAAVAARDEETGEELAIEARVVINATGVYRRRGPPAGRSRHRRLALADAQPGDAHRPRPLVPPRRERAAGPAHRRRPRPVHDPLARPGPGRYDRYARRRAGRRAAAEPGGDRIPAGPRRPLPGQAARSDDVRSTFAGLRPLLRGHDVARATSAHRPPSCRASTPWSSRLRGWSRSPGGNGRPTGGWRPTRSTRRSRSAASLPPLDDRDAPPPRLGGVADGRDDPLSVYGSDAARIRPLPPRIPNGIGRSTPRCPTALAEVVWAARHEAARWVEDVLARRSAPCSSTPEPASRPRRSSPRSWPASLRRTRPGRSAGGPIPRTGRRLPRPRRSPVEKMVGPVTHDHRGLP